MKIMSGFVGKRYGMLGFKHAGHSQGFISADKASRLT